MSLAARLIGAAALPVAGWAAVSFAAPMSAWSGAGLFALAVAGGVIAARNPPPWSLTGAACCLLWVALPIAWWAPAWVPSAVAVWVYYAACLLWLVPFAWTVQWRRDPVEDGEPDEPGPRPVVVRGPGDGIDIGGGSDSFDYPDEDHHPRTPPPGWEPRSMVTGGSPIVGVFADDEPDELDDSAPEVDGPLPGRLLAAWPVKPNGDPYASVHAADLAALVGVDEDDVIAAVTAEFGSCEKVTARPLAPDPATGKRGQATGRKGLRYAALREWAGATARATS